MAAAGLVGARMTPAAIATAVLAVAVTCGLWWSYFRRARHVFEHALGSRDGKARSSLARDVFSVIHFPMLCGVIALAAGTEHSLAHPNEALPVTVRAALGAGAVLFVCGTAVALWRATGRTLVWRWVLTPASAAAVLVAGSVPWAALTMLFAMLVAVAVIEHRQPLAA